MSRPLSITELVQRVGDDNIGFQNLFAEGTFIACNKRKGYDELSFAAYPGLAAEMWEDKVSKVGIVLWIDNEKLKQAKAEFAAAERSPFADLLAAAKGGHWPANGPGCKPECPLCAAIAKAEGR